MAFLWHLETDLLVAGGKRRVLPIDWRSRDYWVVVIGLVKLRLIKTDAAIAQYDETAANHQTSIQLFQHSATQENACLPATNRGTGPKLVIGRGPVLWSMTD